METFVIRLWTPADGERRPEGSPLRGLAEHVGGGERTAFTGGADLLAFLESMLDAAKATKEENQ